MGPILFAHNENIAYVMPHVTAHAMTSCVHHMVRQELLLDVLFMQAEQYLWKLTA